MRAAALLAAALALAAAPPAAAALACDATGRGRELQLLALERFSALFPDAPADKFEASGLEFAGGRLYAVFDSDRALASFSPDLPVGAAAEANELLAPPAGEPGEDPDYEGIAYNPDSGTFYVVQEAAPAGPPRAAVVELALAPGGGAYGVVARCELDFELDDAGKGIEGLAFVSSPTLGPVLIALCEGNSCLGGGSGRDPGAGRALVARLVAADATINSPCRWEVLKTIDVPASADFQDYSGLAPSQALGAMAVLSQEDAALWVGGFDFDAVEFRGGGAVFPLPRDADCRPAFCNAEGIAWLDGGRIAAVTDRAKGKQPAWCEGRDQSAAVLALPPGWERFVENGAPASGAAARGAGGAAAGAAAGGAVLALARGGAPGDDE